jgi:hypothetical protein
VRLHQIAGMLQPVVSLFLGIGRRYVGSIGLDDRIVQVLDQIMLIPGQKWGYSDSGTNGNDVISMKDHFCFNEQQPAESS